MPAAKVGPGRTEHHHHAAGHVLAAVVADTLHHGQGAGITHRETFARHAAEVDSPAMAPYNTVLPTMILSSARRVLTRGG